MFDIVTYGEPVLTQKAEDVTSFGSELEQIVADMHAAMRLDHGIGLAAPQVGISKRIFIVGLEDEPLRVFINPVITGMSKETSEYEEGCLSFPGLYFNVVRPAAVEIEAYDIKGKKFQIKADGLLARVIQHEYDHLEGILFIDRISPVKRARALAHYHRMLKM
ncbi:MAG: peptide deformylase [Spirochaetales bacterium]|nr:peptide deformylase [Spirochaetales bacterium]